jgi:hypothetical protein
MQRKSIRANNQPSDVVDLESGDATMDDLFFDQHGHWLKAARME